jgi:ABC-type transport system involved in cytochrome c biogenesis ATPase subunit
MGFMADHLRDGGLILAATHAPLDLAGVKELRLDSVQPAAAEAAQ